MNICLHRLLFIVLILVSLPLAATAQDLSEPAPYFDQARLSAAGRQTTVLHVHRFGRYAVTAASSQGTALQLVDRMAGPGKVFGRAGHEDGRLDVFLDRGEYLIVTHSPDQATGEVELDVHAFTELRNEPTQIVERKLVSTHLGDFQQVSYWIHLTERRRVWFEAAGRHLHDLRLWHNGHWLIDARPATEQIEPREGQPLLLCQLAAELNPGLYRLTAYGGLSQPWSEDTHAEGGGELPLHLRFGFPQAGKAGRRRLTVSPFGFDRVLIPGEATYVRIELPEARPARLEVRGFSESAPFAGGGSHGSINKESLPPVTEVWPGRSDGRHLITVKARAGQPYVLQHFEAGRTISFKGTGQYYVSSIHSGHPSDSVDATALLVRNDAQKPLAYDVVELDSGTSWSRRANLLDTLSLFLRIEETATYEIHASGGAEARFRIEPFLLSKPSKYEPPPFHLPGHVWSLDAGFYVLTVKPEKKGILELEVRATGWLDKVRRAVGLAEEGAAEGSPVQASVRFPSVALQRHRSYRLFLNQQPEVRAGAIVRRLPLDLTDPLPLTQRPGEVVEVPFYVREPGLLRSTAEDGSQLDVSVDGGEWSPEMWVGKGRHDVKVRYPSTGGPTLVHALELVPQRLLAETPLPLVPAETLAALPDFPVLTDREARFFDLEREESKTFLVSAERPGLYRLETTGLLATEGNLRTRVVTSLHRREENGVGRNFLVQRYLREGDYQISVAPRGRSAGHLGLHLRHTAVHDGGYLAEGVPARAFVEAGEAIAYGVLVTEKGRYRLRSIGVGRTARARLEEGDGWPVAAPATDADITRELEPGEYRLILLPEPLSARSITLFERLPEPVDYTGHGPHPLPLSKRVRHRWLEGPPGEERPNDVWRFDLTAAATVRIDLTDEMQGDVMRAGTTEKVAYVPPQRSWEGRLPPGEYELLVTCVRVNNQVDYSVGVWPQELLPGQSRQVRPPVTLPISLGDTTSTVSAGTVSAGTVSADTFLMELASFGATDVRARLYSPAGELVAENDDRPGDWNFLLADRLPGGIYQLRVDPVASSGPTQIDFRLPEEHWGDALMLPVERRLDVGRGVHVFPLEWPDEIDAVALAVDSAETVGVSLEVETRHGWRTLASRTGSRVRLEMPSAAGGATGEAPYRLRIWSLDQRGNPVDLQARAIRTLRVREADLTDGLRLRDVSGSGVALVAVELERPGCFELSSEEGVRFAVRPGQVATGVAGPIPASSKVLWLAADLVGDSRTLDPRRRKIEPGGDPLVVRLGPGARAICDVGPRGAEGETVVVRARAIGATPLVELKPVGFLSEGPSEPSAPAPDETGASGVGLAGRAALGMSLAAGPVMAVAWSGEEADTEAEVSLEALSVPAGAAERASWGALGGELSGYASRTYVLPAGKKRFDLVLGPSTAAALSHAALSHAALSHAALSHAVLSHTALSEGMRTQTLPRSLHWADREPLAEVTISNATVLTLVHLGEGTSRFRVGVVPVEDQERAGPPRPGRPFGKVMHRAGSLRWEIPPTAHGTLHVRGARAATWVGHDGRILRGFDLALPDSGGTLRVDHGKETLFAWIDRPGSEIEDLWGAAVPTGSNTGHLLELPAVLSLEGRLRSFRFESPEPRVLHLASATALVTRVESEGRAPTVEVHPHGVTFDVILPPGRSHLWVRSLGPEPLTGTVDISASSLVEIGEGLGPELLIAAGQTRSFSFHLTRAGRIGVGVRADSDVIETVLLDLLGRPLGRGVAQMADLDSGTYHLLLRAPSNTSPVVARPIVVGLERPSTGPPEEELRRYRRLALASAGQ